MWSNKAATAAAAGQAESALPSLTCCTLSHGRESTAPLEPLLAFSAYLHNLDVIDASSEDESDERYNNGDTASPSPAKERATSLGHQLEVLRHELEEDKYAATQLKEAWENMREQTGEVLRALSWCKPKSLDAVR